MMDKVYVQVDSEQMENGDVIPVRISWKDGRSWKSDLALFIPFHTMVVVHE